MRRRNFMQLSALSSFALGLNSTAWAEAESEDDKAQARDWAKDDEKKLDVQLPSEKKVLEGPTWTMPDEGAPHAGTWMSFGARADVWGDDLLPEVQHDLVKIAKTIAKYEPVSMLVNRTEYELLHDLVDGHDVKIIEHPVDDLWIRDTGPTFVKGEHKAIAGIDFNFNGWGLKQTFYHDASVAKFIAHYVDTSVVQSSIVMEGGALEVDGEGTAIITESCVLNPNRNPRRNKKSIEQELKHLLGLEKIIWLPGIKDHDITDAHTDFYARFVKPGVILVNRDDDEDSYDYDVTRRHIEILKKATDAKGRKLKMDYLIPPTDIPKENKTETFAAGYVNFYVGNGFVIMPKFGDRIADKRAYNIIKSHYPDRTIEQISISAIASGGGGIHCATQQQIKV